MLNMKYLVSLKIIKNKYNLKINIYSVLLKNLFFFNYFLFFKIYYHKKLFDFIFF